MKMNGKVLGLVWAASFTLLGAGELWAQTATNLICAGCVDSTDIANGSVDTAGQPINSRDTMLNFGIK